MANLGTGDVLAGILGGLITQGISIEIAIKNALQIRQLAVRYYLEKTKDIIVNPEDIIDSIRFIWPNINRYE